MRVTRSRVALNAFVIRHVFLGRCAFPCQSRLIGVPLEPPARSRRAVHGPASPWLASLWLARVGRARPRPEVCVPARPLRPRAAANRPPLPRAPLGPRLGRRPRARAGRRGPQPASHSSAHELLAARQPEPGTGIPARVVYGPTALPRLVLVRLVLVRPHRDARMPTRPLPGPVRRIAGHPSAPTANHVDRVGNRQHEPRLPPLRASAPAGARPHVRAAIGSDRKAHRLARLPGASSARPTKSVHPPEARLASTRDPVRHAHQQPEIDSRRRTAAPGQTLRAPHTGPDRQSSRVLPRALSEACGIPQRSIRRSPTT